MEMYISGVKPRMITGIKAGDEAWQTITKAP
jgi:hypothetical protein